MVGSHPTVTEPTPIPEAELARPVAETPPVGHVFIVGLSRSGTTLMRKILNEQGSVAIAPESHFLGHLLPGQGVRHMLRRLGDLRDDATIGAMVDFLYDGGLERASPWRDPSGLWTWIRRKVPREELRERLLAGERSERGIFTSVMQAFAARKGGAVMGDKTPAHLRYVDLLLDWYADARVVHMMRDPRAIFVSELRRRRSAPGGQPYRTIVRLPALLTAFVLLETTLVWADGARRARGYHRRHPRRYRIVRFEDLVTDPERVVRELCAYLGLAYTPTMLDQVVVSRGSRAGEAGIDTRAADRWRDHVPGWVDRWFQALLGGELRRLGYLGPRR
jgi:Sulfotransferase family